MGIGPVPAVRKVLDRAGLTIADIDLFELNEAFAAQSVAVARELGLDAAKVNVNGGAIALGHPIGASGARVLTTLVYALRARKLRYGVASLCIGGGMGIAMAIENLDSSVRLCRIVTFASRSRRRRRARARSRAGRVLRAAARPRRRDRRGGPGAQHRRRSRDAVPDRSRRSFRGAFGPPAHAALEVVGFYHSHPRSAPEPSPRDLAEFDYPDHLYAHRQPAKHTG